MLLLRLEHKPDWTLGVLIRDGKALCWSLEPGWHGNMINKSCIPCGQYELINRPDGKWEIAVPSRTGILFHAGNSSRDSKGCVLPGMELSIGVDGRVVLHSREAMEVFRNSLQGLSRTTIEVINLKERACLSTNFS